MQLLGPAVLREDFWECDHASVCDSWGSVGVDEDLQYAAWEWHPSAVGFAPIAACLAGPKNRSTDPTGNRYPAKAFHEHPKEYPCATDECTWDNDPWSCHFFAHKDTSRGRIRPYSHESGQGRRYPWNDVALVPDVPNEDAVEQESAAGTCAGTRGAALFDDGDDQHDAA